MNSDEYWPYARAMAELKGRLQATDDEIRMWVYLGHADGGLDTFDVPIDCPDSKLPKRHFTASEVGAYYLRHQIESFAPDDSRRYLTLSELVTKWVGHGLSANKADELGRQLIEDGRLTPINALRGHHAQVMDDGAGALISDLSLFALDQVIEVEALEFSGAVRVVDGVNVVKRPDSLTAVIKIAKAEAPDPENRSSVWATLKRMAQRDAPPPPLLGFSDGEGVKYLDSNDEVKWLTRNAFGMRLSERKKKPRR